MGSLRAPAAPMLLLLLSLCLSISFCRGLSKNVAPSTPPILPPTPISPVTTGVSTACGGYTTVAEGWGGRKSSIKNEKFTLLGNLDYRGHQPRPLRHLPSCTRPPSTPKETMDGRNGGNTVPSVAGRQSGNNFTLTTHARQYHFGASSDAKQQLLHNGR